MADNFFFYDYESFGINPAIDRPAQFAGIRTDLEFNIIGEPVTFYCKQTNDYLPKPTAVLITGILPQQCNQLGISEPEFAEQIHQQFSQANTCILGYNNIRYDDEVTRYLFYRNFIDPYAYSWQQNNSRWDLLDLVRACYALRPTGINWPLDDATGMPSFKLELLTKANNIEHQNAHDATADVYATIAIAKLIRQQQPKLFKYFYENRGKKQLEKMIDIIHMTPLVHVSGMFGTQRYNLGIVVPIAWHPHNKNAVIVADLTADTELLLNYDSDTLRDKLYTASKDLMAGESRVPLKLVHLNKSPILAPLSVLTTENAERLQINKQAVLLKLEQLRQADNLRNKIIDIYLPVTDYPINDNVETKLYAGFFNNTDRANLAIIHQLALTSIQDLRKAQQELYFHDPRIEKLIFHYCARHSYTSLSRAEQVQWDKYRRAKLASEIEAIESEFVSLTTEYANNPQKMLLLEQLSNYIQQLVN